MGNIRKRHDAALKAKVAIEAVKAEKTISEISNEWTGYIQPRRGNR